MQIFRTIALIFTIAAPFLGNAQKTIVSGTVTDKATGKPLEFVQVFFVDTKFSTVSDLGGNFTLETYYPVDSIRANVVGYHAQTFKVKNGESQEIHFQLDESVAGLEEVTVTAPKEDPAIRLFKLIIKHKKVNNREKLDSYEYEVYNKLEFDLNNVPDDLGERKVFKSFNFIFDYVDTTGEKPYLPIFLTETVSDFHYRKNPKSQKEIIRASKVSGVQNESISQFVGDMYTNVNIYENNIDVFGKSFISPISDFGRVYYNYYLTDSSLIESDWCYQITFFPKRKQELTFEGNFWVHDTTYAIRKLEWQIADDANINFVNMLWVNQEYEQVEPEVWMLTKDQLIADFYITKKSMGFYGRKTATYLDFRINDIEDPDIFKGLDRIEVLDGAMEKGDEYWDSARHEPLSENEQTVYFMVDSLGSIPQVQTYIDIIATIVTGYLVLGPVKLGPYTSLYSFNQVEGHRFRFGGKTSIAFSKRLELSGHVAYGLRDEEFKYGGGFRWLMAKHPRTEIGFNYLRDVELMGKSQNAFSEDAGIANLLRRTPFNELNFLEEYKGYIDREWFYGFNTKLMVRRRRIEPLGVINYAQIDDAGNVRNISHITSSEIVLYSRFAHKENFVGDELHRVSLGSKYPVVDFQYSFGIKDLWGGQYNYRKAIASVNHWFSIGVWGWMRYRVEAGKIWGTLPFPLLELHPGNESFYYDDLAFNTMNFFEFVSDQYAQLYVTHHFDGFFLNKIPLIRKLKLREVASFNILWGSLDEKHEREMLLLPEMHRLTIPYAEATIGIENIFKVLRVDAIWRMTYLDHENIAKFGIRFKFDVDF